MEDRCRSRVRFTSWKYKPRDSSDSSDRGILVPGGFGQRGTEGMMLAIKWAREQKIPFLGICLGFQLAVIEWARNVCGLAGTSYTSVPEPPRVPTDGVGARFSFESSLLPCLLNNVWTVLTSFGTTIQVPPLLNLTIKHCTLS